MKLLANENLAQDAIDALRDTGHDVGWIRTDSPGMADEDVLARAVAEDRILLTFDKDFGELAFRYGLPATCGIILCRFASTSGAESAAKVAAAVNSRQDWAGHFSVIDDRRVRMRPLPQTRGKQ